MTRRTRLGVAALRWPLSRGRFRLAVAYNSEWCAADGQRERNHDQCRGDSADQDEPTAGHWRIQRRLSDLSRQVGHLTRYLPSSFRCHGAKDGGGTWRPETAPDFGSKPRVLTIAFAQLWLSGPAYTRGSRVRGDALRTRATAPSFGFARQQLSPCCHRQPCGSFQPHSGPFQPEGRNAITRKTAVTTTSEHATIQTRVQDAEGAAGGNLDQVRDLLFGGQMRDYDRKFARLEERLAKETTELRDDVKKRLAALEGYMKAEIESLSDRLRVEQDARGAAAKDLARELHETAQQFGQKTAQLDDAIARSTRDFREQLHAQRQELSDDLRQRIEDVLGRLAREASELRSDKADRSALAALLTEMAMRLNGDLRATALEAEVRG